jgi:hypothetical protein
MGAARTIALLVVLAMLAFANTSHGDEPNLPPIRVTVVVIYATSENNVVDKKLTSLAKEMQKRETNLIGFELGSTLQKSILVGGTHTFKLDESQTLSVAIDKPRDPNGRVGLTLTAPGGTVVTYTCVCGKFFPLLTEHKTLDGKTVIVAVGAKPCTGKGP